VRANCGPLVVIGDSLLDIDLIGATRRRSPDAGVPVVELERQWVRPGGAGLAAILAARSGTDVVLVTALADDDHGRLLTGLLAHRVEVCPLPLSGRTSTKMRVTAERPLVRIDSGHGRAARGPLPEAARRAVASAGGILVADYGRGVAETSDLAGLIAERARDVAVVWDPHPDGPLPAAGCWLVTPNLTEASSGRGSPARGVLVSPRDWNEPQRAAQRLAVQWSADAVAVTLGSRGAVLAETRPPRTTWMRVPPAAPVPGAGDLDPCGAGDQLAVTAAYCLMRGAPVSDAVRAGVREASEFVRAGGVATVSTEQPMIPALAG
jgi:bifunctional ADP-heptose synthase (sugar kinase/adenylyltransferase)